jgi:uncharacterized membrane protein YoaT (DUF817 family)
MKLIQRFDQWLLQPCQSAHPTFALMWECLYFCLKHARAGLFAGLFFIPFFITPTTGMLSIARDDILFGLAIGIQIWMHKTKLQSNHELKMVILFYVLGFILEYFKLKTATGIETLAHTSWSNINGVPLFVGFIYAALSSYMMQAWRLFTLRIRHYPPYWMAITLAGLSYLHFFSQHDYVAYFTACAVGLYGPSLILFKSHSRERQAPLLLSAILIGGFIYLANSICHFYSLSNPISPWPNTHQSQSVFLLIIFSISIIVHSKHLKPA